jgi:hypothetical protein
VTVLLEGNAADEQKQLTNIKRCLPLGMLSVGDGITDNVLEEDLENTASLLVDETGDTLDTTTASETTNSGLGDT